MKYKFWGWENAKADPITKDYIKINNPIDLYDILSNVWSDKTCAPRMRSEWTPENKTLGQCSITAFLVQDIFGGLVYGIPLGDGNYHCFNVINDNCKFDLTSEQFGDIVLDYDNCEQQYREMHFSKEEKRLRYEYLKEQVRLKAN